MCFNVGSAKVFGIEGSLVALAAKGTRINLNATYLHTKFGNGITINTGSTPPVAVDIGGNRLPNAPEFTASGAIEQEIPVSFGTFTARIDAKYSSDFYYSVFNTVDTRSADYVLANASLKFAPGKQLLGSLGLRAQRVRQAGAGLCGAELQCGRGYLPVPGPAHFRRARQREVLIWSEL